MNENIFKKDVKNFFDELKKKHFKKNNLKLHEPVFSKNTFRHIHNCIKSTFVSPNGKYNELLERKLRKITNSKFVICLNSGTSALFLSLKSIGIVKNDEVLLPSLTFVSTANAVLYNNAIPHFVDSSEQTLAIDPILLEKYLKEISIIRNGKLINKKTKRHIKCLICVHVFGNSAEITKIRNVCKKYNLLLIEDAAEALNSYYKDKHLGTYGKVGILSFNGNKIITSGSGGAILTNDKKIFNYCNHIASNAKINDKWEYKHDMIGYNLKMANINAALAFAQILDLNKIQKGKNKLMIKYKNFFKKYNLKVELITPIKNSKSNNWLISIRLKNEMSKKKNKVLNFLWKNKIYARPLWIPLHKLKHLNKFPRSHLNNTNKLYERVISLPSGPK